MDLNRRLAVVSDEVIIKRLFQESKSILGNYYFDWVGYLKGNKAINKIYIYDEGAAILHIKIKSSIYIQTIAVSKEYKRMGYGRAIIMSLPRPIELKTDADNDESNSFYISLGFKLLGESKSANGKKTFNHYILCAE